MAMELGKPSPPETSAQQLLSRLEALSQRVSNMDHRLGDRLANYCRAADTPDPCDNTVRKAHPSYFEEAFCIIDRIENSIRSMDTTLDCCEL